MSVLRRLYETNQIRHFLVWLALYLVISIVAINIGAALEMPNHTAVAVPLAVLAVVMLMYLRRSGIDEDIGLGVEPAVSATRMWFYLPLVILVALPLLRGIRDDLTMLVIAAMILHYVGAGFLEEALFRGLLLQALLRKWRPLWAVVLTGLTFGFGHATSLFIGQTGTDTMLQIINATVVGLIFTLVVIATGSLTAVIVVHILYNVIAESSHVTEGPGIIVTGIVVLLIYGSWLLFGAGALDRLRQIAISQRPPDPT